MSVVLLVLGIVLLLASIAYYKYKKSTYVPIPEPGQYIPNKVKNVPEKKDEIKKPKKEKKKVCYIICSILPLMVLNFISMMDQP